MVWHMNLAKLLVEKGKMNEQLRTASSGFNYVARVSLACDGMIVVELNE